MNPSRPIDPAKNPIKAPVSPVQTSSCAGHRALPRPAQEDTAMGDVRETDGFKSPDTSDCVIDGDMIIADPIGSELERTGAISTASDAASGESADDGPDDGAAVALTDSRDTNAGPDNDPPDVAYSHDPWWCYILLCFDEHGVDRPGVRGTDDGEILDASDGVTNGSEWIYGLGGDDFIYGLGGDDIVIGGDGHDTLTGGAGADWLSGGDGRDTASYLDSPVGVVVNLATGLGD